MHKYWGSGHTRFAHDCSCNFCICTWCFFNLIIIREINDVNNSNWSFLLQITLRNLNLLYTWNFVIVMVNVDTLKQKILIIGITVLNIQTYLTINKILFLYINRIKRNICYLNQIPFCTQWGGGAYSYTFYLPSLYNFLPQ